jgi:hypothetical protein
MSRRRTINANDASPHSPAAYGRLCPADMRTNMNDWLNAMPATNDMTDPGLLNLKDAARYRDWLDWAKHSALAWLDKLDDLEVRYRAAGFKYHKIPYKLRHVPTLLNGMNYSPNVLEALSRVFKTGKPRSQQYFFNPWLRINDSVCSILTDLENIGPLQTEHWYFLGQLNKRFEERLIYISKMYPSCVTSLSWYEDVVSEVAQRADTDDIEALANTFSVGGGLFRLWVSTMPEAELRPAEIKPKWVEWDAEWWLMKGVEPFRFCKYWRLSPEVSLLQKEHEE